MASARHGTERRRSVLAIVHTVTSATRLLDVLPVLEGDHRIRVVFSAIPGSSFAAGVTEFLTEIGARTIPWAEATRDRFDLAIAAGNSGELHRIKAPLIIIPHGIGYNKYLNRESRIANRESRISGAAYGLAAEQLLHNGRVVPSRIVVSHEEQLRRLEESCPAAVPHAVVAGDPCFDRMLTSLSLRDQYRTALGLRGGERLVVVASTWGPHSLLESSPELIAGLLADLPVDDYRVAAIVHPGVWYEYGPWQVATWLADCRRAGLLLIPPHEGWRAALVAADCVIGDHGSVTLYGAAIGAPTLLASFHAGDLEPGTAMAGLGGRAARLRTPYIDAIEAAVTAGPLPGIAGDAVAVPGESARLLRDQMYELMNLTPRERAPRVPPVPLPVGWDGAAVPPALLVTVAAAADRFHVARYPVEVESVRTVSLPDPHLVVDDAEPDHRLSDIADVVIRRAGSTGRTNGLSLTEALAAYPRSQCVADVSADRCVVAISGGPTVEFGCASVAVDPAVLASAVYHHLESDIPLPPAIAVHTGRGRLTGRRLPAVHR